MEIVLLAAGRGIRLGEKTKNLPKTLLPLQGVPLCSYILKSLLVFNPSIIHVVGGFYFSALKKFLEPFGQKIHLIENKDYQKGNLITLLQAKKFIKDDFCMMNADHFYSKKILTKIFNYHSKNITAVCDFDRSLLEDDMKVFLTKEGRVSHMDKQLKEFQAGYVGMSLIPRHQQKKYWETCDEAIKKNGDQVNVEAVINECVKKGELVDVLDVSGSHWIEVDTAGDLLKAEQKITKVLDESSS